MTSYQHSFDNSFSDSLRRKRDETTDGYLKSVLDVYLDEAREFNRNNPSADDTDYSKASYDQVIKESVLKRHGIEGTWDPETKSYDENTENQLYAQMKYNPAATPENFKEAFGTCDESGCYWADEVNSNDYYTVGKGGGTAHAKRGQAAARAKALGGRAKRKGGKGNDGGVKSDIQLKENITYIDKSPEGHSIYEWNYKGEPKSRRYQGVMAQELLETAPHAVVTMDDGYLGVKYDEIDVDFINL